MRTPATFFLIFVSSVVSAQLDVDKKTSWSWKDRGYYGIGLGGLGFGNSSFGTYYSIGLTPQVGYMIARNFSGGAAFEFQYTGYPDIKAKEIRYGWYPYLRYNIKQFFIQTDYDWYNIDNIYTPQEDRQIYNRYLIGIGYFARGRGRSASNFLVSYDFLYSSPSQFNSPIEIRIFFTF